METGKESIAGRYQVIDLLGQGGMGQVWSAFDRLTKRKVAVKRLALSLLRSPDSGTPANTPPAGETEVVSSGARPSSELSDVTRSFAPGELTPPAGVATPHDSDTNQALRLALAQEFRVLASLRHPGIISVLDYGFDQVREPYFTMELLEEPLDLLAATSNLGPAQRVALIIAVLQALVYLHRREILHRDLKPHNVLVEQGNVKVLDFGLAVNRDSITQLAGTVRYMAPEIFQRRSPSVSSDLFAVGVMAYEVLTGSEPFPAWKRVDEMLKRPMPDFADVRALQQQIHPGATVTLEAVITRLLATLPEERYASAAEVIDHLSAAIGVAPPTETSAIRESFLQAAEFVGREGEIKECRRLLDTLAKGRGGTVLIGGESGVGKSRLVEEIRAEALVRGALVVRGQAVADAAQPYHEWREPLRRLCLSSEIKDDELAYLQVLVPDIGDLLERQVHPISRPDPGALHHKLLAAAAGLFRQQQRPVLLILEDLHWTNEDSMSLLHVLNQLTWDHPLLIVGTFRNDEQPDLPALFPRAHNIKLSRLQDEAIVKLSKSILGDSGTRPEVLDYLKKQTEGNVFFLVEVVRSLAESAGGLEMIVSDNIPESLTTDSMSQIVRRRLNRVPAEWWPLMEVAAVAGRQVDVDLLQLAMPGNDVAEWLRVGSECVVLDLADGQWRFAHDKLREAILASFSPEKSCALHEQVARAIEAAHEGGRLPSSRLAYHWGHAGNLEREQHYAARAGAEMLQGAAYAGAIAHLERALALLPQISQDYAAQELPLQLELGTAYLVTRGHASSDMKRAFDRAGELCVALGDPSQLFRVLFGQATFYLFRGELDACREFAERCVTHAANSKDPDMLLEAHFALGNALYWQGEFAGAMDQANLVIQQFQPYQHEVHTAHFGHNPRITCLTYGAWSAWALGYPDRALKMCHEALELAEKFDHGFSRAIGLQTLLFAYNQRRDVAETRRCAELLLEKAGDYPTYWIAGRFLLGWALIHQNAVQDGTEIIRDAWNRWQQAGAGLAYPLHTTFLIEATIQSGEWAEGLMLAEDALAHARKYSERSHEAELCRLRGELIWKSTSDPEQALACFREAVEVARRQQALSYELRALNSICLLGLDPAARGQLAAAFQRFTEGFDTQDLMTARQILEASR